MTDNLTNLMTICKGMTIAGGPADRGPEYRSNMRIFRDNLANSGWSKIYGLAGSQRGHPVPHAASEQRALRCYDFFVS